MFFKMANSNKIAQFTTGDLQSNAMIVLHYL